MSMPTQRFFGAQRTRGTGNLVNRHHSVGRTSLKVTAFQRDSEDPSQKDRSAKGKGFEKANRRRGRPAHLRTPYDTPMRDGNRDRLIGLLTERAAKTLMVYLQETNYAVCHFLMRYLVDNPIPKNGNWDDVSGETFLRKLLAMPIEMTKVDVGRDPMFDNAASTGVDPRSLAQRIMEIRTQLAKEFIQDLSDIAEENNVLLRETLTVSLTRMLTEEPEIPALQMQLPKPQQHQDPAPNITPSVTAIATNEANEPESVVVDGESITLHAPHSVQPMIEVRRLDGL